MYEQGDEQDRGSDGDSRSACPGSDLERIRLNAMKFAGMGTYRYRMDGTIVYMDEPTLAFLGLEDAYPDPSTVAGKNMSDLIIYEKGVGRLRQHVKEHGVAKDFEYRFRRLDGQARVVLHHSYLVPDPETGEQVIQVIFRDITARKRAEAEVERMQRLESLGTIAGGIAHDFNNLLMVVFGNIELARLALPESSDAGESLDNAIKALHNATKLTGQLLTFSKGGFPHLENVDTAEMVVEAVRFNLHGKPVSAQFDLPDDLWDLRADKGQIDQALANLTLNAVQAMPRGGTLHVEGLNLDGLDLEEHVPGHFVCLTLRDEGVGIPAEMIDRIFDPYYSTKAAGRGLGLSIVHSIVMRHGGRIRVRSATGEGATFTLYLPASKEKMEPDAVEPGEVAVRDRATGLRILVMDDEPGVRELVSRMVAELGHDCATATEGGQAVKEYGAALRSEKPFDLVILDLTVTEGMGGRAAIEDLKRLDPAVRAMVSSGYADDPVMADYRAHGFYGRVIKPYRISELEEEIERVMG